MINQNKLELHYYRFKSLNITVSFIFLLISFIGMIGTNFHLNMDYIFFSFYLISIILTLLSKINNILYSTLLLIISIILPSSLYIINLIPNIPTPSLAGNLLTFLLAVFINALIPNNLITAILFYISLVITPLLLSYKNIRYYFLLKKVS